MTAYDTDNVFAKILAGEMAAQKVYEDDHTLVIMDIMPRATGHALVLPKAPSRNILDIEPGSLAACVATVQKVARAAKRAFAADGISVQHFVESAGGQMVFHTHWHVLPRFEGEALRPHSGQIAPPEVIEAHAVTLRDALSAE